MRVFWVEGGIYSETMNKTAVWVPEVQINQHCNESEDYPQEEGKGAGHGESSVLWWGTWLGDIHNGKLLKCGHLREGHLSFNF